MHKRILLSVISGIFLLVSCVQEDPQTTVRPDLTVYRLVITQETPGAIIDNDIESPARCTLYNGETVVLAETAVTIAGRGNSTWYYSFNHDPVMKLPYKLKFPSRTEMPGMGSSKKWVLLANRFDKSLIKNMLAFDLAQSLSFQFTNRYQLAELYLDGKNLGLYLITDQVEVDDGLRVTTGTIDPETDAQPGFLVEWDDKISTPIESGGDGGLENQDYFYVDDINQDFAFKGPKADDLVNNAAGKDYISTYIRQVSAALLDCKTGTANQNAYKSLIDVNTFYDFFIVNEFARNNDAANYSSIYLTKPKNEKLKMGPVWDFDIAFGFIDGCHNPETWYIRDNHPWFSSLIKDNDEFATGLVSRWNAVKQTVHQKMIENIDYYESQLTEVATQNHEIWGELGSHIDLWDDAIQYPENPESYADVIDYLRNWVNIRYQWMDTNMNNGSLRVF